MYTRDILLLSVISILVYSRITVATYEFTCNIPSQFTVDLMNDETANLHDSELTISLKKDSLVVTSYEGTDKINIQATENVVVTFNGYMETLGHLNNEDQINNDDQLNNVDQINNEDQLNNEDIATESERISQTYTDQIAGIAQRSLLNSTGSTFNNCRLVLLPVEMDRPNVDQRVANEIRRLAESCLELKICPRIDKISVHADSKAPKNITIYTDPLEIAANPWKYSYPQICDDRLYSEPVQDAINKVVDVALSELIAKLMKNNPGPIMLPNIDKSFSIGAGFFKTTAYFTAANGTFRDVTTIRRITDATLSHKEIKFMGYLAVGLTVADLEYSHYMLKYGFIEVIGKMSGKVDGAALKARIAVDYNRTPCSLSIEYLKVAEFGKMSLDLTGLGPLNFVASSMISWITKAWREDIIMTIETKMRAIIQSQLSDLDCEKFRP